MIKRYSGTVPTRSRAVAHDGLIYAVHTAPTKSASLYEQTRDALVAIDRTLAEAGSVVTFPNGISGVWDTYSHAP